MINYPWVINQSFTCYAHPNGFGFRWEPSLLQCLDSIIIPANCDVDLESRAHHRHLDFRLFPKWELLRNSLPIFEALYFFFKGLYFFLWYLFSYQGFFFFFLHSPLLLDQWSKGQVSCHFSRSEALTRDRINGWASSQHLSDRFLFKGVAWLNDHWVNHDFSCQGANKLFWDLGCSHLNKIIYRHPFYQRLLISTGRYK